MYCTGVQSHRTSNADVPIALNLFLACVFPGELLIAFTEGRRLPTVSFGMIMWTDLWILVASERNNNNNILDQTTHLSC